MEFVILAVIAVVFSVHVLALLDVEPRDVLLFALAWAIMKLEA